MDISQSWRRRVEEKGGSGDWEKENEAREAGEESIEGDVSSTEKDNESSLENVVNQLKTKMMRDFSELEETIKLVF